MLETSARLLRLLALLQARRFWTGPDLADRLEVTERTVRRDVDRLRSLGYPVESSSGVAGGYQLGVGASLPPLLLEDDEALAVALGLRTAAAGTVTGVEEAALRALGKVERVLPERLKRRVAALRGAVSPLYFEGARVDAAVLSTLAGASRDRVVASFAYGDGQGRPSHRHVEPHGLVHTGSRWYLVAFDRDRDDWRTFRVDRIEREVALGARFAAREVPGGDVAAYVSRSIAAHAYGHRARVIIHAPRAEVAARVPPLAGHLEAIDDHRCLLESGGGSLEMLAVYIAHIGHDFEVVEPPALVDVVRELAGRLGRAAARSGARGAPPAPARSSEAGRPEGDTARRGR